MLLERMNKGVSKIVIQIFALLLIASFGVWGIGDMTGIITRPGDIATVGGEKVGQREFQEAFRREMEQLRRRAGNIDMQQARSLGIAENVLNSIISRRLLSLQAHKLGLLVSDAQIANHIRDEPAFHNKLGQFDRTVYENVLANNGLTESTYVASLRQDIQQGFVARAITGGVTGPASLAQAVYEYRNEKRSAEVIVVKRQNLSQAPQPSPADLKTYLDKHSEDFMAPEYRRLTVLYLNPEQVAKELSPSPERIKEEYQDRLASLSIPERRRLEQMLFKDEKKADAAYAALTEGRTFATVAKDVAGESAQQTDLGLVTKDDLLPNLAAAAFALKQGAVTKPLKSPLGWHIIKVVGIQPGHKPTLAEVKDKISNDLAHEMALDDLVKRANKIEDAIAGGASIAEAGKDVGAEIINQAPMNADEKLQAGTPVSGLPPGDKFIQTAFSLEKGATSRLLETDNGGYFMVRVDDIIPPAKRPLSAVHDKVETAWKTDKLDEVAKKKADEILKESKAGKSLKDIASETGLALLTGKPFNRVATSAETFVPPALIEHLFDAKKGETVMAQIQDGYAVGKVTNVDREKPAPGNDEFKNLENNLGGAIANDLLKAYTLALRSEYDVSVNEDAIRAFYANQPQ